MGRRRASHPSQRKLPHFRELLIAQSHNSPGPGPYAVVFLVHKPGRPKKENKPEVCKAKILKFIGRKCPGQKQPKCSYASKPRRQPAELCEYYSNDWKMAPSSKKKYDTAWFQLANIHFMRRDFARALGFVNKILSGRFPNIRVDLVHCIISTIKHGWKPIPDGFSICVFR